MKAIFLMIIILLAMPLHATMSMAQEKRDVPQFDQYLVKSVYKGEPATIDPADESMFHTRLADAAKQDVNFAGEYVLTVWGCGAGCFDGAAVNLRTGKVAFFPGAMHRKMFSDDEVLQYRINSRLFMMTGYLNEDGNYASYYYELTDNTFKRIKMVELPE